ncbi:MAG: TolC family protein, partial [Bacteroidota bacterium]
ELDVILEVAQRYFTYLQVLSLAELQNNNIKAVNQNLIIASDKQKVGYSGASDVYRWQTELDLAKTDLYQTNAQLKSLAFQLNETLNRPLDEVFAIEDSDNINQFLESLDEFFLELIEDQTTLDQFADFMVQEAFNNLPEVQQIELAIAAQERLLKSNKRAFYLPSLGFGASYDYPVRIVNPADPLPIPGLDPNNNTNPTWNAAFKLSIPILAGGSRKFQKEQTQVGLYQLQDQQKEVKNLLELQVRANLEQVNASYNNIRLTKSAAEAAEKNIGIVQDLYKSGQVNVITLVDAQNAFLGSQINAVNAAYEFMIDFFSLQRSVGDYNYLATEDQKSAFLQRFLNFKNN